ISQDSPGNKDYHVRNTIPVPRGHVAPEAMEILDEGFEDTMTVMMLPEQMRPPLRTTNYLERENGELERRYAVIRIFPNVESINRLMGAVLIERHDILSMRRPLFSETRCIIYCKIETVLSRVN